MDLTDRLLDAPGVDDAPAAWASSGAMALTGRTEGPPLPAPDTVADTMTRLAQRFAGHTATLGREVRIDGPALLGERAALAGTTRRGTTSVGGATHLLRAADGWVAVALARPHDHSLVPAWLDIAEPGPDDHPWPAVADAVAHRAAAEVVEQGALLGLPVARLGETPPHGLASAVTLAGTAEPTTDLTGVLVVDLSSLWAGPLCTQLLAEAGARVVKVESPGRPDGARLGPAPFFDLMNAGKASVAVDLATPDGRHALATLLRRADVVIEASRPRALQQLGLSAADLAPTARARVWCALTAHGRHDAAAHRVGFGDDAAVAGGLVAWEGGEPRFCADAVADPATALVSAVAVLDRLCAGGRWLVDVALARTAAHLAAGTTTGAAAGTVVAPPRARPWRGPGPALGADTEAVLRAARWA